jgi:hypothetical protein
VSTREKRQVFDRQIDALRAAGCHRIFDDCGSQTDPSALTVNFRTDAAGGPTLTA